MGAGRPPKYSSVEEVEKLIEQYFRQCQEDEEPITITGLALALDLTRQGLCEYAEKPEFSDTIKRAKLRVENAYEQRLVEKGRAGDIFALKNFGWTDKQEIKHEGGINIVPVDKDDEKL